MIEHFIANEIIRQLAQKPYWTVNVDNKKPLDILEYEKTKRVWGATSDACLTDLSNLLRIINAVPQQFVYNLNAARDGIVILDVEKTCPEDIKAKLLQLPFIYGDISMSGLGLHLAFPCPVLDEITSKKIVMKEEHGYFEILLHHYVTFTNYTIFPQYTVENAPIQFQEIWDELRETQRISTKSEITMNIDDIDLDFPNYETLKDAITRNFKQRFKKTPANYSGDMSRYEFAVIGSLRVSMMYMLDLPIFSRLNLDITQQIAIIYKIACEYLEYRPKHDEIRDGKPMLLYQTYNSFVTNYEN